MATGIDLNDLDLSVLGELNDLKEERSTLMTRLQQMDERKTEVAPAVYLRVRADYETQRLKLETQERPLKHNALEIYAKLRNRIDELEREDADAKLNLQELEFRHSLGEFDKSQFAVRKDVIENAINDRAADFSTAKSIKDRFLSIFGSERELELAAPNGPEATVLVTPIAPPPAAPAAPLPPISPYTPIPQANVAASIPGMPPIPGSAPAAPEVKAAPEPRRPSNPDATVVFRPGRLTPMNPEAGIAPTMLSLKPIAIGSDNACDVRLSAPNIQRKQVEITLSRAGFMLKDVGGGGVVSIDGLPVTEQILRDGDAIQIGAARFSFKLA
jgi:Inner membrane component of T3SS, cytoplasmic domain